MISKQFPYKSCPVLTRRTFNTVTYYYRILNICTVWFIIVTNHARSRLRIYSSSTWQSISRADRTIHVDCCNNGWVKFADPLLQSCHKVVLLLDWIRGFSIYNVSPDSEHSLGQRWHFVGTFVGPTLTNDVGYMSCCSSGRRLPTSPAYVNVYVMPTIISQVLLWTNVGSSWFKGTAFFQFFRKSWFSLLCVIVYNNLFPQPLQKDIP